MKMFKQWKVKEEGSLLFPSRPKRFYDKKEAMNYIKENLPKGGIFSQAIHMKLFERNGLRWRLEGCYFRDAEYSYKDGEAKAKPLGNVVLACKHVKEHLDKNNDNSMFLIRAKYLHIFCKKNCTIKDDIFDETY